ncbi:MAG TPA: glycoside hydrolase family 88 protein [Verrucomicrobiae bacterium]|nr:glycoside hydrolase family 88 protein [Verrucomicrobiae bacterium]
MKTSFRLLFGCILAATVNCGVAATNPADLAPAAVLSIMERVADWQLANPSRHRQTDWTQGAGDAGFMALARLSSSPRFEEAMIRKGETNEWQLGPRIYHADDHVVGQAYCELFFKSKEDRMIAPLRTRFDYILENPRHFETLDFTQRRIGDLWSWCDALFMAPPTWVRLWKATGKEQYLEFAITNWWRTSDYLYDKEEHLYFRDSTYFNKREANGRKVFWSRGNGWVMGGLVRVMEHLTPGHAARGRFEQQFKEMADAILRCQQPDGLWRSSLLDPESYPLKETSGSGFHTYALAWGINNGLLERQRFERAVRKAWSALAACVNEDGKLTHVQPIGADPKKFDPESTEIYGVGAFLLAGSEMHRLLSSRP